MILPPSFLISEASKVEVTVFELEDFPPPLFFFFLTAFQVWASAGGGVILLGLAIQTDPTWKESAITQPYSRSIGRHHQ